MDTSFAVVFNTGACSFSHNELGGGGRKRCHPLNGDLKA